MCKGSVKGGRRQGKQKKRWEDNIGVMGRPGVRQIPVDSGEQRKMEETGHEVIHGVPTTLAVQGYVKVKQALCMLEETRKTKR